MRKPFRVTEAMRSRDRITAALGYAKAGVSVLALYGVSGRKCDCGDPDCQKAGKHPLGAEFPHGHLDATRDRARLEEVFSAHPNANIGIVPDGDLIVVDVDGPVGEASIESIPIPLTPTVRTGRGRHLVFRKTRPLRLKKFSGVDFRLDGKGYVVAAPSTHASGVSYRLSDEIDDIAPLPDEFYSSKTVRVDFSGVDKKVAEGGRNNFLASLAGTLRLRGLGRRAVTAALLAINGEACEPPLKSSEVAKIAKSVGRYRTDSDDAFGSMTDVVEEDVKWLYFPYFPRGAVTLVDGDPGLGKSSFSVAVVAALTQGRGIPWSQDEPRGRALLLSAEDDPARVQKPRLLANNADTDNIRYARELFSLDENGLAMLRAEMVQHKPDIVIIDPIIAYMAASFDLHKATDMTRFFTDIDKIAKDFDCAMLVIRHLRKSRDGDPLYQGLGSIAVAGRVRSALVLGRHPDDPELRAVAHTKSNYGPLGRTIVFDLKPKPGEKVPGVTWLDTEDITPDDLLRPPSENTAGRPPKESEQVERFLRDFLAGRQDRLDLQGAQHFVERDRVRGQKAVPGRDLLGKKFSQLPKLDQG
jgi:Bifunctional DNA primase/polymerase, N-terminal/AAA domain/Primase C terminal 1 (PriCT-1)